MVLDQWIVPIEVRGEWDGFELQCELEKLEPGLHLYHLTLTTGTARTPPQVYLQWAWPGAECLATWHPTLGARHTLPANWGTPVLESRSACSAPVVSLHHLNGDNRLTIACDDALHAVGLHCGVVEETGCQDCRVHPFRGYRTPATRFDFTLRLDSRRIPLSQALADTSDWWAAMDNFTPMPVPDAGLLPMYSTWYSFHQQLDSASIEAQCKLAYDIGCRTVIVDDGWQTNDNQRGYAYTGDWQPQRLTDIKEHIQRVHELGMKYMLWYSVPFVGYQSRNHARFKGMYLYEAENLNTSVLDPRYPQVRQFLIQTYLDAQRQWNPDGFKLDFVDCFRAQSPAEEHADALPGRDIEDVYQAVDVLLKEVIQSLKAANPEILIEFRQSYIGPLMRTYGNLFRAADCPMDPLTNRVQTLNLRMLSGNTAVHSDMFMWHPDEPVESAALQLLNVFFSVPQVSVRLEKITADQHAMLKHYLSLWVELRQTLMGGTLRVRHPQQHYTFASMHDSQNIVGLNFCGRVIEVTDPQIAQHYYLNVSADPGLVLRSERDMHASWTIRDCMGRVLDTGKLTGQHVEHFDVPAAGMVQLTFH